MATYRYDAFGNTITAEGAQSEINKYRFSTKPLDLEIKQDLKYYYGYRYYQPQRGRWLSMDPIQERGGLNLYRFVNNNGISKADFLGLFQIKSSPWRYEYFAELTFIAKAQIKGLVVATGNCDPDTGNISNEALQIDGSTSDSAGAAAVWKDIGIGVGASVSVEFSGFVAIASEKKGDCTTKIYQFTAKSKHQVVDVIRTLTQEFQTTQQLSLTCCCKEK